jgi:hypothetical protein
LRAVDVDSHKEIPIVRPATGMWALPKLIGKTAYGSSVTLRIFVLFPVRRDIK